MSGRYPKSAAARNTLSRVSALAPGALRKTNDTKAWDTPTRAATSRMVGLPARPDVGNGNCADVRSPLIQTPAAGSFVVRTPGPPAQRIEMSRTQYYEGAVAAGPGRRQTLV